MALAAAACCAGAADLQEFSSAGLPRSEGIVVRVLHPAGWQRVPSDDPEVIAELRGAEGAATAILQVGRGAHRDDIASVCQPGRAVTMLQGLATQDPGTRVTDLFARQFQGRPGYELRYERSSDGRFLAVHSLIICLKDTRVVVSCAGAGARRNALGAIEPICTKVLESVAISED